jgi:hypothetical protein
MMGIILFISISNCGKYGVPLAANVTNYVCSDNLVDKDTYDKLTNNSEYLCDKYINKITLCMCPKIQDNCKTFTNEILCRFKEVKYIYNN